MNRRLRQEFGKFLAARSDVSGAASLCSHWKRGCSAGFWNGKADRPTALGLITIG
jgi:hypothetical protein